MAKKKTILAITGDVKMIRALFNSFLDDIVRLICCHLGHYPIYEKSPHHTFNRYAKCSICGLMQASTKYGPVIIHDLEGVRKDNEKISS